MLQSYGILVTKVKFNTPANQSFEGLDCDGNPWLIYNRGLQYRGQIAEGLVFTVNAIEVPPSLPRYGSELQVLSALEILPLDRTARKFQAG